MCDQGPFHTQIWRRREVALAKVEENKAYCVHFSSIRGILTSKKLEDKSSRYPEEARVHIEYFQEVPTSTSQDPRNLWLRKMNTDTGGITITNTEEDPWDTDILLFLPDGASPVIPESTMMDIYVAMVIGQRSPELKPHHGHGTQAASAGQRPPAGSVQQTGVFEHPPPGSLASFGQVFNNHVQQ